MGGLAASGRGGMLLRPSQPLLCGPTGCVFKAMQSGSSVRNLVALVGCLLAAGLAGLSFSQHQTIVRLRAQQRDQEERLQALAEAQSLATHATPTASAPAGSDDAAEQRKELMRLRNEVTQLRKQVAELEVLRDANAKLLQAVQSASVQSTQLALVAAARKQGAILGVLVAPAPPGQPGILVTGLDPTSPVAGSGIQPGDLIYALDGRPVQTPGQLQAEMLTRAPGQTVVVDVLRTNTSLRFQVQTRAWPQ